MEYPRLDFLRRLLDTPSPSGFETAAQRVWRDEVATGGREVRIDRHGNAIATLPGQRPAMSVALMAHIDEIGLMVKYVDESGFLYVGGIGGVDVSILPGERVRMLGPKGEVAGVIGRPAIHLQGDDDKKGGKPGWSSIWVDIGAKDKAEAQSLCPVGTPGVFGQNLSPVRHDRWIARDFDNKVGAFIVAEVFRRIASQCPGGIGPTLHAVSSVQEECTSQGARAAAYDLDPTFGIAVDVSHDTTTPDVDKKLHGEFKLGGGPIANIGVRTSKVLFRMLSECAANRSIPLQVEAEAGRHGTDADAIADVRAGIPVLSIGPPLRYMHTSIEMVDLSDVEATIDLLTHFLIELPAELDLTPR